MYVQFTPWVQGKDSVQYYKIFYIDFKEKQK